MAISNTVNWGETNDRTVDDTNKNTLFDKKPTLNANRGFVVFFKCTGETGTLHVDWVDGAGTVHTIEDTTTVDGTLHIKDYDYCCGHIRVSFTGDTGGANTIASWMGLYGS